MRKICFACLLAMLNLVACNDTATTAGAMDDQAKKNLEASRMVAKAFQTGDLSGIDSVIADDFVDHTDRGDKIGPDSLKAMVNYVRTNFKDMKMETIAEMADKDYVFQWMRYQMVSDGSMGPAGTPIDARVMEITRFRDGKAVEHWGYMDPVEIKKMYGPAQSNPTGPADSINTKPAGQN